MEEYLTDHFDGISEWLNAQESILWEDIPQERIYQDLSPEQKGQSEKMMSFTMVNGIQRAVALQSSIMRLDRPIVVRGIPCLFEPADLRIAIKSDKRELLSCSSMDCSKLEKDSGRRFKLCAGCKMTHYCCRLCQKRAWPQHKTNCQKLSRMYAL